MEFWKETFEDTKELFIMENNASIHEKMHIPVRQKLEMKYY